MAERPVIRREGFLVFSLGRLKWEEEKNLKALLIINFFFFFSMIANPFSSRRSAHKMEDELQHMLKASPGTVIFDRLIFILELGALQF